MSMIDLLTYRYSLIIVLIQLRKTVQFAYAHFHPQITRDEKLYC